MIDVVQAFDRVLLSQVPTDDADSLEVKLSLARERFKNRQAWIPPYRRVEILSALSELMRSSAEKLALQISHEGGKPLTDARVEVERAVDGVRSAIDVIRTQAGCEIPMGLTSASDRRRAWSIAEPIGVVAAVSAFNHPLNLAVHQIAPAIAAGCPIIIKPATRTPMSCMELVRMVHEAGMPEGWVQTLVTDDRALGEALVVDSRVAFFSFIGSGKVGWYLRSKLAPGTRCALEHGGVAPAIIDKSVDLDQIIEPLAKGGYYHAGQVCVSVQRIYVHRDILDPFMDRFTGRVASLRVGDPTLPETEVGPLIAPAEVDRVESWIEEAKKAGSLQFGGGRVSNTTLRPSIILDPPRTSKVASLEVFGPVTCVMPFETLDAAIEEANSLPFSFQSSIFTQNLAHALDAAERLDASAVMINDHTAFRVDWMPFAGRHASGYGVGGVPYTTHEMTSRKMIVFHR
ncbi:aldehyde dehydrogenase family protein [Lysobacter sp. S4-A87]|uniref:aldehyde dehydrogenase family protein n=1 Tax=Lysobacter sp. S4-A87 TaxID=2925843 RepID=UPI001F53CA1E|nr:aldehyde dehydrogenase family protein [Lysobacter sp. S4-A87]UNK49848.1 aldehyde dehydrogenase family protein [Lysobacter sp. S4-A87]